MTDRDTSRFVYVTYIRTTPERLWTALTTNDFTASGGDGYPNFRSRMTTQDILDQDLADYIAAKGGLISPVIQHRIHCTDSDPGTAPACPVGSP